MQELSDHNMYQTGQLLKVHNLYVSGGVATVLFLLIASTPLIATTRMEDYL